MEKDRELVLRLADAEQETVAAMNGIMQKHGLPCYLYEPIVDKIHRQVIEGKTGELVAANLREAEAAKLRAEQEESE